MDEVALRFLPAAGTRAVLIADYNAKPPNSGYLAHDLQFSAYAYASTRREFWATFADGDQLFGRVSEYPRWGEWVALAVPKRMDAGPRTQLHDNAVDQIADSLAMGIYPPTISGDVCNYCEYCAPAACPTAPSRARSVTGP